MKHFLLIFQLFIIAATTTAQSVTYQTQFPYSNTNQPYSIYKAPDNSTFVFGDKVDACGSPSVCNHLIYVHHFDAKGKFLWTKDYRPGFSLSNPSAIATKDGGFAFLGRLYDTLTKTWKGGLLVKCNRNGDIIISRQLRSKKYTAFYPKGLAEDNDGNLLLFYDVANDMYYSNVLQIVKLNAKGNIVWNKTGTITNAFSNDIYEGVSFQQIGNRYYISGANNCQICEGVLTANVLVMDTSNTVLNCLNITADGDYTSTSPTKILIKTIEPTC